MRILSLRPLSLRPLMLGAACTLALFGCEDDEDVPVGDGSGVGSGAGEGSGSSDAVDETRIAIVGDYDTNFGGFARITETEIDNDWYAPASHAVVSWSNAEQWIIAQNDASDAFNPGLFSRFDYLVDGERVWWCQTVFDAVDAATAAAVDRADASDPATGGCGGAFPWTELTPGQGPMSLSGEWVDGFGQGQTFSGDQWVLDAGEFGTFTGTIVSYSNAEEFFVSENGDDNGETAGLFSRVDWTLFGDAFYYCQTAFDAADAAAAEAVSRADDAAPDAGGCGDFAWSRLDEPAQ